MIRPFGQAQSGLTILILSTIVRITAARNRVNWDFHLPFCN